MLKQMISSAALAGSLIASGPAFATNIDLDLGNPTSRDGQWWNYSSSHSYNDIANDLSLKVTGWSYVDHGYRHFGYTPKGISSEKIGNWSVGSTDFGLGVERAHSPNHAIDNAKGDYDMLLLNFTKAVTLAGVTAGWRGRAHTGYADVKTANNGDLSVLAYQGSEVAPSKGFDGKLWQDLLEDNWRSAGSYQFGDDNKAEVNSGGLISKFWLVGAYNKHLTGGEDYTEHDDFFKVSGVSVDVAPVPIPGSMLLFGASLIGFGAYRRRKAQS